jgi:L-ascorbate metabolism protein UlaG (beta-lactamase superfamily)
VPGECLDFGDITVESVGAYNVKTGAMTPHPKSALNVGYIIRSCGISIYHAGDTDYTPEMEKLTDITAALVPIDGEGLTMTTEKAAEFINHISPRFAVPMHYNIGTPGIERFLELVKGGTQVIIMDGQQERTA